MTMEVATIQNAGAVKTADKSFTAWMKPFIEEWFKSDSMFRIREQSRKSYRKSLIGKSLSDAEEAELKKNLEAQGKSTKKFKDTSKSATAFAVWIDAQGITQPTKEDVKKWCEALDAVTDSVSTKNLRLTTLRNFYRWLSAEYGVENIVGDLKGWRDEKEHKRGFLSCDEMKKLLECVDTADLRGKRKKLTKYDEKMIHLRRLRDKAIIGVLLTAGLRTIEISRLRTADIKHNGGVCFLNVVGKGRDSGELVKISRKTEKLVRDWQNAREGIDLVTDDSPLFCSLSGNSFGEKLSSNSVSTLCKKYLEAAELKSKEIVAHSLRHSLATNALLKGASLREVQQQLRHANLNTTQVYLHEAEKSLNRCSDLVSEYIF